MYNGLLHLPHTQTYVHVSFLTDGERLENGETELISAARERACPNIVPSHLSRLQPLSCSLSTGWLQSNAEVYTQQSCRRHEQDEC